MSIFFRLFLLISFFLFNCLSICGKQVYFFDFFTSPLLNKAMFMCFNRMEGVNFCFKSHFLDR
jgi:hypothetical protein